MESKSGFFAVLFIASVLLATGCKKTNITSNPEKNGGALGTAVTSAFGTTQNDSQGYAGHLWDSTTTDGLTPHDPMSDYNILVKAIGPPGDVINGTFLESEDTSPKIAMFSSSDGEVDYGFYDKHLAFALAHMNEPFTTIQSDLQKKYQLVEDIDPSTFGDGQAPARWNGSNFAGSLYKRGNSNTRVYLMQELREGGDDGDVYLLYIPNKALQDLRNSWWSTYSAVRDKNLAKQRAAETATQQSDQTKIQ